MFRSTLSSPIAMPLLAVIFALPLVLQLVSSNDGPLTAAQPAASAKGLLA